MKDDRAILRKLRIVGAMTEPEIVKACKIPAKRVRKAIHRMWCAGLVTGAGGNRWQAVDP